MKKHLLTNLGDKLRRSSRFETEAFDPATHYAVIRGSICTGEKVAGFRDRRSGQFTEVMLIRSPKDEEEFKKRYKADTLKVEY